MLNSILTWEISTGMPGCGFIRDWMLRHLLGKTPQFVMVFQSQPHISDGLYKCCFWWSFPRKYSPSLPVSYSSLGSEDCIVIIIRPRCISLADFQNKIIVSGVVYINAYHDGHWFTEQNCVCFLKILTFHRLFQELLNQCQACLYLFECVSHCDFKYRELSTLFII